MYYKEVNNMTTISLRLSDADNSLIKKYAELNGMSVSESCPSIRIRQDRR